MMNVSGATSNIMFKIDYNMGKVKNTNDFLRGYNYGVECGKREALIEYQKENPNKDLPCNDVLYRIFDLWFECQHNDEATSSVFMNSYEHYANYITTYWNKTT
jgi:hypothetical protein